MKNFVRKTLNKIGILAFKIPAALRGKIRNVDDYVTEINKKNIKYPSIRQGARDYELIKNNTMVPFENLMSLYELVRMIEYLEISGDFVECGVWKGGAIGMMALANLEYANKRRALHLFDSFDDICEPDPSVDGARAMQEAKKYLRDESSALKGKLTPMRGFYDFLGGHGTIEECEYLLATKIKYDRNYIHFYKGWFQESFREYAHTIEKVSLLRLDSDWYESTKLGLEYFYDKVQVGGIVIIDDYGAYEGCKKAVDEFFAERKIKKHLFNASSLNDECYYLIK